MKPQDLRFAAAPRAARLTNSLRDIGYDLPAALADLVDNSLDAGARHVDIELNYDAEHSYVTISDDGEGMPRTRVLEALRFGSDSRYRFNALGRYGLGLKTASLSQCRRVTVISRSGPPPARLAVRSLDLDAIDVADEWILTSGAATPALQQSRSLLEGRQGTVVLWENLDRLLPAHLAGNGWGQRRLADAARRAAAHLGMVFHRRISGESGRRLRLRVNGESVAPWDPFARDEGATEELPPSAFEIASRSGRLTRVALHRYVLPPRARFSSPEAFERLSGPLKWNRQQGLYIYRSDRMVQSGGWNGLRAIDEHTKLARASLDFSTDLDSEFRINVAKMRVAIPRAIRQLLEQPLHDLALTANASYRRHRGPSHGPAARRQTASAGVTNLIDVGLAIRAAALEAGQLTAIEQVEGVLRQRSPDLSRALGFS